MGGGEAQQGPSAAVLAAGQGLGWKAAKAQTPSACQSGLLQRGTLGWECDSLRRPELGN